MYVPRTYLWQLLCNVSPHKHSFQVDPEVLDYEPIFNVSEVLESFCTHRAISFLKGALYLQPNSIVTYLTGMQACTPMLNYKSMFQLPMGINTNKAIISWQNIQGVVYAHIHTIEVAAKLFCQICHSEVQHKHSTALFIMWNHRKTGLLACTSTSNACLQHITAALVEILSA